MSLLLHFCCGRDMRPCTKRKLISKAKLFCFPPLVEHWKRTKNGVGETMTTTKTTILNWLQAMPLTLGFTADDSPLEKFQYFRAKQLLPPMADLYLLAE